MKANLMNKRKGKQNRRESVIDMSSSCPLTPETPQLRKKTHGEGDPKSASAFRKWSLDFELVTTDELAEPLKKYITPALKQYSEIKNLEDPDKEVKKIMKLLEGGKSD